MTAPRLAATAATSPAARAAQTRAAQTRAALTRAWAGPLLHPLPLGAVLLLAINDHWLKGAGLLPQFVTGKLSDLAGLFYFPLLLVAVGRGLALLARRPLPRAAGPLGWTALASTALVFATAKLWLPFNSWFSARWGHIEPDPTDLIALAMLVLAYVWLRRSDRVAEHA